MDHRIGISGLFVRNSPHKWPIACVISLGQVIALIAKKIVPVIRYTMFEVTTNEKNCYNDLSCTPRKTKLP